MINIIPIKQIKHPNLQNYINTINIRIPELEKIQNGVCALKDGKVVGMAGFWLNDFHPNREYVFVYVSPSERRKKIGTLMYQELETISRLRQFQMAFDGSDKLAESFVTSVGFSLARETWEYSVEREDIKEDDQAVIEPKKIKQLSELSTEQFTALVQQQLDDYRENHLSVNPLKDISAPQWKSVFCDEMILSDSFVLLDHGDIKCYLIAYESEEDSIFIGYTGSCLNQADTRTFFSSCIGRLFERYSYLELEIDSTDKQALLFSQCFQKSKTNPWRTWIKTV